MKLRGSLVLPHTNTITRSIAGTALKLQRGRRWVVLKPGPSQTRAVSNLGRLFMRWAFEIFFISVVIGICGAGALIQDCLR
jgi:hypothetical protein